MNPGVYIVGSSQLKVEKKSELSIREMVANAIRSAINDAGVEYLQLTDRAGANQIKKEPKTGVT